MRLTVPYLPCLCRKPLISRVGLVWLFLMCLFAGADTAWAEERILSFRSDITVNTDSSLLVREEISVNAEGQNIRRGIFRDFPTEYRGSDGRRVRVGFEVTEVLRNGSPENYSIESITNGKRIRIGNADRFLPNGTHTYTITYHTTRQLGYFEDFDELYWNVTGNGWQFTIDQAVANVTLPAGATFLDTEAYTGGQGAKGKSFQVMPGGSGRLSIRTTSPLAPYEGLTIAASWPKGFVEEPSATDETWFFISDNAPLAVAGGGFFLVLAHYLWTWHLFGRDPARGTIIPRFSPPNGFSPAASRFVRHMGYDRTAFAAALINMAVKGYLKITERDEAFALTRLTQDEGTLSNGEKRIAKALFGYKETIELEQKNHKKVMKAISTLKEGLEREFQTKYFETNAKYFFIGMGATAVIAFVMALVSSAPAENLFMVFWLSIWSIGTVLLAGQVANRWRTVFSGPGSTGGKVWSALGMTLFGLPFFIGEILALGFIGMSVSFAAVGFVAAMIGLNALFFYLLKAPTYAGARIHDELDGFKMYLETAEKDRLEAMYPPTMTPELFEKFLPYALALGVEQQWSESFSNALPTMDEKSATYSPRWYSGSGWNKFGASNFASSLGSSIATAAVASSTAPGSSSGSSGGGFSGGGGGGGGGGGW